MTAPRLRYRTLESVTDRDCVAKPRETCDHSRGRRSRPRYVLSSISFTVSAASFVASHYFRMVLRAEPCQQNVSRVSLPPERLLEASRCPNAVSLLCKSDSVVRAQADLKTKATFKSELPVSLIRRRG